jgi:hypothetical protein
LSSHRQERFRHQPIFPHSTPPFIFLSHQNFSVKKNKAEYQEVRTGPNKSINRLNNETLAAYPALKALDKEYAEIRTEERGEKCGAEWREWSSNRKSVSPANNPTYALTNLLPVSSGN